MVDPPSASTAASRITSSGVASTVESIAGLRLMHTADGAQCGLHSAFHRSCPIVAARRRTLPSDQVIHHPHRLAAEPPSLFAALHKFMLEGTLPRRQGIAALMRLVGVQCGEPATASARMSSWCVATLLKDHFRGRLVILLLFRRVLARGDVVVEGSGCANLTRAHQLRFDRQPRKGQHLCCFVFIYLMAAGGGSVERRPMVTTQVSVWTAL